MPSRNLAPCLRSRKIGSDAAAAAAAAAARNDLIAVQQRLAVETASHAAERKGLEAKLAMAKDVRKDLEAKLTSKKEEISMSRKEIAELLNNMKQFEALIPLLKCGLKLHVAQQLGQQLTSCGTRCARAPKHRRPPRVSVRVWSMGM